MKITMVVRKRVKTDGISGIKPTVDLICDLQVEHADKGQLTLVIDPKEYDLFEPGSIWEANLEKRT